MDTARVAGGAVNRDCRTNVCDSFISDGTAFLPLTLPQALNDRVPAHLILRALMIARVWRCTATRAGAERYAAYFGSIVQPHLATVPGFHTARLLQCFIGSDVEILVVTEWDDEMAIRRFAGDDIEAAVVEPEALALLLHSDARVRHYQIMEF